jgi:hypothetical protein
VPLTNCAYSHVCDTGSQPTVEHDSAAQSLWCAHCQQFPPKHCIPLPQEVWFGRLFHVQ